MLQNTLAPQGKRTEPRGSTDCGPLPRVAAVGSLEVRIMCGQISVCVCVCVLVLSCVPLFVTPWTVACQLHYLWDSPGKNAGVGCHPLLQGIFPTQWSNPALLHCRQILYHLSHQRSPAICLLLLLLLSRFSRVQLCATPQMAAHQAPPSLGFSRQEHWSGLPLPSPMHDSEKWKWSRSVVSDSLWPMDCSLPGSSVHGSNALQLYVLEPWYRTN